MPNRAYKAEGVTAKSIQIMHKSQYNWHWTANFCYFALKFLGDYFYHLRGRLLVPDRPLYPSQAQWPTQTVCRKVAQREWMKGWFWFTQLPQTFSLCILYAHIYIFVCARSLWKLCEKFLVGLKTTAESTLNFALHLPWPVALSQNLSHKSV